MENGAENSIDTILANSHANKTGYFHILFWTIFLICMILLSVTLGRYPLTIADIIKWIKDLILDSSSATESLTGSILLGIRLPRIIAAILVGAALSAAGAAYQGIFCNPMVSPDILGASAGAGFGAAVGILLGLPSSGIQLLAFFFALIAVFASCFITSSVGRSQNVVLVLVLAGMVVSSLFGAFLSVTKYLADPYNQLPAITFWLMGSLASIDMDDIVSVVPTVFIGLLTLFLFRWRINVLAFGDQEAKALGVNTKTLRLYVIAASTLITAAMVSVCGQIAWVGLIIPHLSRMLVGPNYNRLLPVSVLMGASYMLIVDNIARNVMQTEIPLGILTSIIGAPFFILLLLRSRKGWA